MKGIGFMVICLAMMTGDSDSLIVPALLLAIGTILILMDTKRGETDGTESRKSYM